MKNLQTMRREFVGNVSHELSTPLAAIKAIVDTLQDGALEDRAVAAEFLVKIQSEVAGMTQMVSEFIELSRIETGKVRLALQPINLNQTISEVVAHLGPQAERQQVSLETRLAPDLPVVQAERARLQQAIVNIVHNAVKFTPAGGKVTVSSEHDFEKIIVKVTDNRYRHFERGPAPHLRTLL